MKIFLLAVGKMRSRDLNVLANDYASRLTHYLPFEIFACRDDKDALSRIGPGDFLVLLDQCGDQITSKQLAEFIQGHQMRGTKKMPFFVGGPDGAGDEIRKRANSVLGLSRMTLPHELAQVVMLEQLYRACTILKGEPYHK